MPITYYPDRVQKRPASYIELSQRANKTYHWTGGGADNHTGVLWPNMPEWSIKQISLNFSSSSNKTYSVSKLNGRGIIKGLNDNLWFKANGAPAQNIVLSPGFYTVGADTTSSSSSESDSESESSGFIPLVLVDELKAKLDANAAFVELGLAPFTVSYSTSTGLFTITPDASEIQFLFRNESKPDVRKTSTGGPVFGLTASTALSSSISSDTSCIGFGLSFVVLTATNSSSRDVSLTDDLNMSVDDALSITVTASGMSTSYNVSYKEV
jgi:hypothetical protein